MISIRRRSGKNQSNFKSMSDDDFFLMSEDDIMVPVSESGSESSDWDPEWTRSTDGHTSRKRAKLPKSTQKTYRTRKSLSLLVTMPLDVLFEILSLLSPKDLVHLARTNKPLRETLIARGATTVWKSARKNVGCPDCPADFSELRWATLIFGTKCQVCGAPGVLNIDFYLRRRVCVGCRKRNLVVKSKFPIVFPDYDPVILDFIPYSNIGGWAHGRSSGSKFYWESDVDDMARRWGLLQKDLHLRLVGARQKIDEFRATRLSLVETIIKHADTYDRWARSMAAQKRAEGEELRKKRYDAIVARFNALGYSNTEIESVSWQKECLRGGEITERVWKRIQPLLEPRIQEFRKARILAAHEAIVVQRTAILKDMYNSYLKTLRPSQWLYHPRLRDITDFSMFETLINADDDVVTDNTAFQRPMSTLPGVVSMWSEQRMTNLRNKITLMTRVNESPDESAVAPADALLLATSIFECGSSRCGANNPPWGRGFSNPLFAWEGAITHQCKSSIFYSNTDIPTELEFSENGFVTAERLVSLAGLNPAASTPADMDQLDPRFFCSHCITKTLSDFNSYGRLVYSWRSGVAHSMSHGHPTDPSWQILTIEQATTVRLSEAPDPVQNNSCWTCNHCTQYLDSWQPRQSIVEHLVSVHDIADCHEPGDLFHLPYMRRSIIPVPILKLSPSDQVE